MNGCENAVEYVYQYIDDELTLTRKARVRWHLRRCGHCVDAFQFETQLKARIKMAGKEEPPADFFTSLRLMIEAERGAAEKDC
ncbi:MAG: zf-HC2 domain-containing protein [Actinomycetota bacterium]|jgi:mycothiol system anti-sigma-R factor|nr:zf-HC2 domain-containing protein [Actinomycetota bacterium]